MPDQTWIARQWRLLLSELGIAPDASTRWSRVQRLEIEVGQINAQVRDRELGTYLIEISLRPLSNEVWRQLIDLFSSQTLFVAQLLAGTVPLEVGPILQEQGISLLPTDVSEWSSSYHRTGSPATAKASVVPSENTPADTQPQPPIRPLIAVYKQVEKIFQEDPWQLLLFRGRRQSQILEQLRKRNRPIDGVASATVASLVTEVEAQTTPSAFYHVQSNEQTETEHVKPLEEHLDEFWGDSQKINQIHHHIASPQVELALLRRLAPPPVSEDASLAYDQLAELYQQMTERALSLAYATDSQDTADIS